MALRIRLRSVRWTWLLAVVLLVPLLDIPAMPVAQASGWGDFAQAWGRWFGSAPPRPRRGWGRGDGFCVIAPVPMAAADSELGEPGLVTNRPLFVWRGEAEWLEVRSLDGTMVKRLDLSRLTPEAGLYRLVYEGELEPGQDYEWVIKAKNLAESLPMELQVLAAADQAAVEAELQGLGASPDAGIRRADYLAERGLWSAFWDQVLSIQPVSPELKTVMQQTVEFSCDAAEEGS